MSDTYWLFVIGLSVVGIVWFLPAMIASAREHDSTAAIFVLTLLLGWTGIGWVIALVWALSGRRRPPRVRI